MTTPQSIREEVAELIDWLDLPPGQKVQLSAAFDHLEAAARAEERERCEFALAKWMLEQPDLRVNVDINLDQARQILTPTNPPNN